MAQKKIKMVTRLGGEEFTVGECSPAQARILSKKDHAKLVDGKLLVSIRPFHLDMAVNDVAAGGMSITPRDPNVSDAELGRRLDWFRSLLGNGTLAQIPQGSSLDKILAVNRGFESVKHLWELSPEEMGALSPEALRFHRTHFIAGGVNSDPHLRDLDPITDEWADSLFVDDPNDTRDDPGPIETRGHREVPQEVLDEDDYEAHIVTHKVAFNFTGALVARGVYDYKGNDPGSVLTAAPGTAPSDDGNNTSDVPRASP